MPSVPRQILRDPYGHRPPAIIRDLLGDPLYRWEARRYWTGQRLLWTVLLVTVLGAVAAYPALLSLWADPRTWRWSGQPVAFLTWIGWLAGWHTALRLPLCLLALIAGATAIVPEKVSGHFEQFVLTPVEPRRYVLMLYAARLKGYAAVWLLLTLPLAAGFVHGASVCCAFGASWAAQMRLDAGDLWCGGAFAALLHLDMLVAIAMDAAVGLAFSATSSRLHWALLKAGAFSFLLVPAVTGTGAVLGAAQGILRESQLVMPLAAVAAHAVLALLIMYLCLKQTERAAEAAFYRPGEP